MQESDPVELLGRTADEHLLDDAGTRLPAAVGRPSPIPRSRSRARIVGLGATLTGVTLSAGAVLVVVGAVLMLADGFPAFAVGLLALGLLLVATHWGWVHVAELTANTVEARQARPVVEQNRGWLAAIEPYDRYEVTTRVADDGSIAIVRTRYRPVPAGTGAFTFAAEIEREERHSGEESAAKVTERAELLRREAARDTERERERYRVAADAYETALLHQGDEQERVAARRAASAALSEQINTHLRDPPLIE